MVFYWKVVELDKRDLNTWYKYLVEQGINNVKMVKIDEWELYDWLKLELHGIGLVDTIFLGIVRKVHKNIVIQLNGSLKSIIKRMKNSSMSVTSRNPRN